MKPKIIRVGHVGASIERGWVYSPDGVMGTVFLSMLDDDMADMVLWDPPFSPRQVAECYKQLGQTVNMETTQASYWSKQKNR